MTIDLLDGTLEIEIFYDCEDQDLEDNICISVIECCPPDERLLRAGQTYLYLTPHQSQELGETLLNAAHSSKGVQPA